jgi:NTE family protein
LKKDFNKPSQKKTQSPKIGFALQGGGAYGSYTRGVLKALLENDVLPSAVTGTSAGAMNGAILTYGLNSGSPQKAIRLLDKYWNKVGALWSQATPPMMISTYPNLSSLQKMFMSSASMFMQPGYVLKSMKDQLKACIRSFKPLREGSVKLSVNAVREDPKTGAREHVVFKGDDLNADTIIVSGNLKEFGPARYKDGNYYDGAYWRNPCMDDLLDNGVTDLIIITIQQKPDRPLKPLHQDQGRENHDTPGHELITDEIHDHIEYIHRYHKGVNLHLISLDIDPSWDDSSRMNGTPQWLDRLAEKGYQDGLEWVQKNSRFLGVCSSYKTKAYKCPHDTCILGQKQRQACCQ